MGTSAGNKFTQEQRDEIARAWVRATPAEKKELAKKYDFNPSLPGYWRRAGLWPKDLTTPLPAPPKPPEEPDKRKIARLTPEQKKELGRRYAEAAEGRKSAFAEALGIARNQLLSWSEGKKLGLHGGRSPYTPEDRARIMAAIEARPPGTPIKDAATAQGINFVTYYDWKHMVENEPGYYTRRQANRKAKEAGAPPAVGDARRSLSAEDRSLMIQAADRYRAEGMSLQDAVTKAGLRSQSNYQRWKEEVGGKKLRRSPATQEQRELAILAVDQLRAKGVEVVEAAKRADVDVGSYHRWKRELAVGKKAPLRRGRPPKPSGALVIAAANRAIHKANGVPAMRSQVGLLTEEFLSRLKAMGAELSKLETDPDGHVTVVVKTTETFRL